MGKLMPLSSLKNTEYANTATCIPVAESRQQLGHGWFGEEEQAMNCFSLANLAKILQLKCKTLHHYLKNYF